MSSSMAEIDPTNGSNINSTTPLYEDPQSQITDLILWERVHGIGLSILAIPANLVVIICLWRDPSSSVSGFSTYAVSVAITDLLVGVVLVPINVTRSYFSTWSPVSCVLWKLLDFGLTSVSMLLFLAMGYDRYRCVRAPLKYRSQFRTNRAMRVSLAVWIVGFLIWIPYLLMKHLPFDVEPFQTTCPNVIFRVKVFDILQVTVAYFIPLLALGAMNVILVRTLKRRPQIPRKQPSNSGHNLTNMSTISGIIELSTMPFEPLKTSPKHENQSPKTLRSRNTSSFKIILMVMVFFVFWLPYCIVFPLDGFCDNCIPELICEILLDLPYFQSALNPLIVIFTSYQIRSKIRRIYRCFCLYSHFGGSKHLY